jgi:glycosyltransferase involved in cell wall biosynthesis
MEFIISDRFFLNNQAVHNPHVAPSEPSVASSAAPIASIVMPCHNAALYVRESVQAILAQTLSDFELIIVEDASKDNSLALVQTLVGLDPRIRLIVHDRNLGASRSRNDGLHAARGEFIGFCDADDLWKPDKLSRQVALLRENPSYDLTYCDSEIIDAKGQLTGERFSDQFAPPDPPSGDLFEHLCMTNFVNMQTVLLRRSIGEGIYFDEGIKWVEDWWQWIRLSRKHRFIFDETALAQYRVHPQSTGLTQKPGILRNRFKVFRRNLEIHHDISPRSQTLLWYQMGVGLSLLGRRRLARKILWRAAMRGLKGRCTLRDSIAIFAQLTVEYNRSAGFGGKHGD